MAIWYCGSVQHAAVAQFAISTAYSVGNLIRQLAAPAVGSERVFRCTTAGTSAGSEPAWNLTRGATTTSGTAVFTEVTGNSTYGWSAASARIDIFGAPNGDTVYVASNHAETRAAALVATLGGSPENPVIAVSVNAAGSVPPVAADYTRGASISITGGNTMTFGTGGCIWFGFDFNVGNSTNTGSIVTGAASNGSQAFHHFIDCTLNLLGNSGASLINIGTNGNSSASRIIWENTKVSFANVGQSINLRSADFVWRATASAISGATMPTNLFTSQALGQGTFLLSGVDLNATTGTIVSALNNPSPVTLANCRINSSATLAGAPNFEGGYVNMVACDDGATTYKQARQGYAGKLSQEATIVRSGGASDGTTSISHKIVNNGNALRYAAFESFPIVIVNTATGSSKTLTVECVTDNVTLTNAEFWIEVEYLGNASYPLASKVSSAPATPMTTAANLSSSSETWTTTGLVTPTKQKATVSFTPQLAGPVIARVFFAKASTTVYYDPKVTMS